MTSKNLISPTEYLISPTEYLISPINDKIEINSYYNIKSEYNNHLKTLFEKNKGLSNLAEINKPYETKILQNTNHSTFTINTPLNFREESNSTHNLLILESYDKENKVLRKTIFIKKNLDYKKIKKDINKEIQKTNIVNNLKDLMDKIKHINKFKINELIINKNGDLISKEKIIIKLDNLKRKFQILKETYNNLFSRKNKIQKKIQKYHLDYQTNLNIINQKELYKQVQYSKMYFNLFDDDGLDKGLFKKYVIIQKELDTLYGLNSFLEKGRIVNILTGPNKKIIGIIQEVISEDECSVTPIFTDEPRNVNIETDDDIKDFPKIIKNNKFIGIRQQKNILNNNYFPVAINNVDTSVKLEIFFEGQIYNGVNTNNFSNSLVTGRSNVSEIVNIKSIKDTEFYNKNGSIFIIHKDSSPYKPGLYNREKLVSDDHLSNKFKNLELQIDWRKKIDNNFVNSKLEIIGRTILPIVIDNNAFPSVVHYLNYEKFHNRRDFAGRKKKQCDKQAEKFKINFDNPMKYLSGENLQRESKNFREPDDWETTKKKLLKKALFAKFIQNDKLKQILLDTMDSVLITFKDRLDSNDFVTLDSLMEVRYLLQNNIDPHFYEYQTDIDNLLNIKKRIGEYIKTRIKALENIDKKTKRFNRILSRHDEMDGRMDEDRRTRIREADKMRARESSRTSDRMRAREASRRSDSMDSRTYDRESSKMDTRMDNRDTDKLKTAQKDLRRIKERIKEHERIHSNTDGSAKMYLEEELEGIRSKTKELNQELKDANALVLRLESIYLLYRYFGKNRVNEMSESDKNDAQIQLLKNLEEGKKLSHNKTEDMENRLRNYGYEMKEMPPNGDCMYYSIIHGMKLKNIQPMDFEQDFHYSEVQVLKNVSLQRGDEKILPVYSKATVQARDEIATKMEINLKNERKASEFEVILVTMTEGVDEYIKKIKKQGTWGGIYELRVASALYNVNFIIYSSNGYRINIVAEESRKLFSEGKTYNDDLHDIPTIVLGYMDGIHYVLGTNRREREMSGGIGFNKLEIYAKDIKAIDGNLYTVSALKTDNNYEILGIINKTTKKIKYSLGNDEQSIKIMNDLGTKMKKYLKILIKINNLDGLEKYIFWQNKLNNNIYNDEIELIGKVITKEDELTGDSYIKFKFD